MAEGIKRVALTDFDISQIQSLVNEFTLFEGREYNAVSIQLDWYGLTGVLDAKLQFIQKNDFSMRWVDLVDLNQTMSNPSDSVIFENYEFSGEVAGVRLTKNGCTGGFLNCIVIAKNK